MDAQSDKSDMQLQGLWRTCLAQTLRDLRRSRRARRVIALPNLQRLWQRRWWNVMEGCGSAAQTEQVAGLVAPGRRYLREVYCGHQGFVIRARYAFKT